MRISRWIPKQELEWKPNQPDGSGEARIECDEGVVRLFTYVGNERQRAFTSLEMWISPYRFVGAFDRHFKTRWWRRICREFAQKCQESMK